MAIRLAKEIWVSDMNATRSPNWDELRRLLAECCPGPRTNGQPVCPEGGVYTIGALNEPPRCSIGGRHAIP